MLRIIKHLLGFAQPMSLHALHRDALLRHFGEPEQIQYDANSSHPVDIYAFQRLCLDARDSRPARRAYVLATCGMSQQAAEIGNQASIELLWYVDRMNSSLCRTLRIFAKRITDENIETGNGTHVPLESPIPDAGAYCAYVLLTPPEAADRKLFSVIPAIAETEAMVVVPITPDEQGLLTAPDGLEHFLEYLAARHHPLLFRLENGEET